MVCSSFREVEVPLAYIVELFREIFHFTAKKLNFIVNIKKNLRFSAGEKQEIAFIILTEEQHSGKIYK